MASCIVRCPCRSSDRERPSAAAEAAHRQVSLGRPLDEHLLQPSPARRKRACGARTGDCWRRWAFACRAFAPVLDTLSGRSRQGNDRARAGACLRGHVRRRGAAQSCRRRTASPGSRPQELARRRGTPAGTLFGLVPDLSPRPLGITAGVDRAKLAALTLPSASDDLQIGESAHRPSPALRSTRGACPPRSTELPI